jgi:uncharacterized protein GlcG (DUF336 family)
MVTIMKIIKLIAIVLFLALPISAQSLTISDVQTVIAQAVSTSISLNQKVTVAVTDHEGNVLGVFAMTGTGATTQIRSVGLLGQGLEGFVVSSSAAAISKAGTASLFGTGGNAFTTRTASFIIQEHFPPGVDNRPGGPLFGVQFSSLTCSEIAVSGLPLGLSGDSGGIPLYKNGVAVGGVGIEGDGLYTVDRNPIDNDQPFEEIIAAAAARGYESPEQIRADNILIEGIRLPFSNVPNPPVVPTMPFGSLPGVVTSVVRAALPSAFVPTILNGVSGETHPSFPVIAGSNLSAGEVSSILGSAAQMANITRAGIRQPIGSNARVSIAVVDVDGKVLGIFRQQDAPVFGFDVSVQKARTAAFFARGDAAALLSAAGFGSYVSRASADGLGLNGSIAFSDRAFGFLHRPLFPDGINGTNAGPFSSPTNEWSPFNDGLQLDLIKAVLTMPPMVCFEKSREKRLVFPPCPCSIIPNLKNGVQIFAGAIPLYRGSTLVGGIGVSGDGIDQDDFIAAAGANNFAPPVNIRSDQTFVRGVRLPFLKFPPRPTLP